MTHLLVIRFSALGDVAMTVPVVRQLAEQYPDLDVTVLSRQQTAPLWNGLPDNVHFFGADFKGRHKGIPGLKRLLDDLDYRRFDAVADLHDILRSLWLLRRFLIAGKRVAIVRKGRWQKWMLTHHLWKRQPLMPMVQRYAAVFARLGFPLQINTQTINPNPTKRHDIGIAPFAAHKGKIYPLEKMEQVVALLSPIFAERNEKIYLFGAGEKEKAILEAWEKHYSNVVSLAGKHTMDEEIRLMSGLRLMLTMDSANMHLASLASTRAISIWGATHPCIGFLGFGQQLDDCIQKDMPCRPCSVYGNHHCKFGDYRCLNITPEHIVQAVTKDLN